MTHEQIQELLWDYRDGTLETAQAAEVAAHCAACPGCRAELAEMDAVSKAASAQLARPAGDEFTAAVMARVRAQDSRQPLFSFIDAVSAFFAGHPARKLALGGGLAAVLAVFVLSLGRPGDEPGEYAQYSASAVYQSLAADQQEDQEPYSYGDSPALYDAYQQYLMQDDTEAAKERKQ